MAPLTRGLQLLASAIRYALASAGLVTSPLLSRPTPCAEWDVAVLLDHVSDSASVLHQAITAGCVSPGPPLGGGSPGLGPVHGLHRQATRLVAVGDRDLTTSMVALAGALEITVHGWDISAACGAHRPIPPGLAVILLPLAPLLITPATRPGLFADPVPVPAQASPGDQLLAFLGRRPHPPPAARTAGNRRPS